ncbi:MAG TPA: hypothetical protein VFE13_04050 [Caulobacteraceae bacterium]|jgi:hypothetical protein|nr:hypothetical protein [Caulobacteraceae bacterium]
MALKFRQYVQNAGEHATPQAGRRGLPDAASWDDLEAYLRHNAATPEVIRAAKDVWNCFLAARREA